MSILVSILLPIAILALFAWFNIDGFKVFSLKGIPFFISSAFIAFFISVVYFSILFSGYKDALEVAIAIIMGYTSVTIHEYAHAITALNFGYKTKKIAIYPFTGIAFIDTESIDNHNHEFWISIAGPLSNIIQAIIVYPFINLGIYYLNIYFEVNVVLAAFNLLVPVYPMDGGRIVHSLILWRKVDKNKTKIALYTSIFSTLAAVISVFVLWNLGNYLASSIVCVMASVSWLEYFAIKRKNLKLSKVTSLCEITEQLISLMKSEEDIRESLGQDPNDIVRRIKRNHITSLERTIDRVKLLLKSGNLDSALSVCLEINDSIKNMDKDVEFASKHFIKVRFTDLDTAFACQKAVKELNEKKFGVE